MSLNSVLIYLIGLSAFSQLVYSIRVWRGTTRGWISVALVLLLALGGAWLVVPRYAGCLTSLLWIPLMVIPISLRQQAEKASHREQYGRARRWSYLARLFHPFDGWWEAPNFDRIEEHLHCGDTEAAMDLLHRYAHRDDVIGYLARVRLCHLNGDWEQALAWYQRKNGAFLQQNEIAYNYLRALGETGDLNSLLHTYEAYEGAISRMDAPTKDLCRLLIFAFCGRTHLVAQLFKGSLAYQPTTAQQLWIATAELVAGDEEQANRRLESLLRDQKNATAQASARRRLAFPLPKPEAVLTVESRHILARVEREWEQNGSTSGPLMVNVDRLMEQSRGSR